MPVPMGLGAFAESFMNTYKGLREMDMNDAMLMVKKRQADYEQMKLLAELAQKAKDQAFIDATRTSGGSIGRGLAGVAPEEVPSRLRTLVGADPNPAAAAIAGEKYLTGTGGVLPPVEASQKAKDQAFIDATRAASGDLSRSLVNVAPEDIPNRLRTLVGQHPNPAAAMAASKEYIPSTGGVLPATDQYKVSARRDFTTMLNAHLSDPNIPASSVASFAVSRQIPFDEYRMLIPEIGAKQTLLDAYAGALGKKGGEGTGVQIPTGAPPSLYPSIPVSPTGRTATVGGALAAQAGNTAMAEAGGKVMGEEGGYASTSPFDRQPYYLLKNLRLRGEAIAKETPQDQQKAQAEINLKSAETALKQAELETVPQRRAVLVSQAAMQLQLANVYMNMIPDTDPMKRTYKDAVDTAAKLMVPTSTPRPALPATGAHVPGVSAPPPSPAPAATPAPTGKIHIMRNGHTGWVSPQFFNPATDTKIP